MNPAIANAFIIFLYILVGLVIVRAFMSWVPSMRESEFGRFIFRATEPLLDPVRRILPTMGGFDLSPLIVIIVINVMIAVVRQAAES
jgi:YggT family protein